MNKTMETINELLALEFASEPVNGLDDLRIHLTRQLTIKQHLRALESELHNLRERVKHLPVLPPLVQIRWAQAVQALPNLAFLELDTTGLSTDAEIIRMTLLDAHGSVLFDHYIKPSRTLSAEIIRITGVISQDIEQAPTIADIWTHFREAITGRYILSYNLDFDTGKLRETTRREHLEEITLIGECLMQRAMLYYSVSSYPKLEALCRRIGRPLPEQPHQTALDRAHGQISLLNAMANAVTSIEGGEPLITHADDDLDDLDEHPF